jgi:mono/diheme cytochrome c family protein
MNFKTLFSSAFVALLLVVVYSSCAPAKGTNTGTEYMPDMGHAVSYEANVYNHYKRNTIDNDSTWSRKQLSLPRNPVKGTVARGQAGGVINNVSENNILTTNNGSVPYYYADTEEERTRAMKEILKNPIPISAKGLERGKELYNTFCGICHGEKANGLGYLYEGPNAKYPAAPANFLKEELVKSSNGRYYHAIMHGKNVMGGYSDKISYEERWQVIHYIRSLQAADATKEYNEKVNTFDATSTPMAVVEAAKAAADAKLVKVIPTAPVTTTAAPAPVAHPAGHDAHH